MMLLLKCPACKNTMKYRSQDSSIRGKAKRCVYCGRSYQVRPAIISTTT